MSFLAPLYLLLAGAVAVPLLLHLMRRRIATRVEFPAVRYLARAERENSRKLRLRNLLLMIIRVLAVLLLALAAARPLGRLIGAGHVPTALAIVLDNSLSTATIANGAPFFDTLRREARAVAAEGSASDRLWLVTADGRVVGGSRGAVLDAIDRVETSGGRGDLPAAVSRAAGLVLGSGMGSRQVAVLTDAQASAWPSQFSVGDVRVDILTPNDRPSPNRAVTLADARPLRWTPRGTIVARVTGGDSTTYRITLGNRTLARGTARRDAEITVRAAPTERGWQSGAVEVEPDELRGDDVRHFAVWVGPAPVVRLDPSAGAFARSAVDALVQNGRILLGAGVAIVSGEALDRLPALIFAPADPVRLGAANRALERAGIPWRFMPPRRDETTSRGVRLDGTSIALRYPLSAASAPSGDTLATAGGAPWIVAGDRYVLIASPLDPAATALPLRAEFVPWLGDIIGQRLSGDAAFAIAIAPGAPLRLPSGIDGIETADGNTVPAASATAPTRAGVYFLRRGATRAGALVVNGEPEESNLERLDANAMRERIRARETRVASDAERWRRQVFAGGASRPLQTPLLVLALILLIIEALLARGAGGRAGAAALGGASRARAA